MNFKEGLLRYLESEQYMKLKTAQIGIAGLGGLGSNLALMLARSGMENFILLDYDIVDWSNLNRQQFWPRHIGMKKTEATAELLKELNPDIFTDCRNIKLTMENFPDLPATCKIWAEAFDNPEAKALFVNSVLPTAHLVVSASGICGIGGHPIEKSKIGKLLVIGDKKTDYNGQRPFAPRVTQAAAMMADCVLEYLLYADPQGN